MADVGVELHATPRTLKEKRARGPDAPLRRLNAVIHRFAHAR